MSNFKLSAESMMVRIDLCIENVFRFALIRRRDGLYNRRAFTRLMRRRPRWVRRIRMNKAIIGKVTFYFKGRPISLQEVDFNAPFLELEELE